MIISRRKSGGRKGKKKRRAHRKKGKGEAKRWRAVGDGEEKVGERGGRRRELFRRPSNLIERVELATERKLV